MKTIICDHCKKVIDGDVIKILTSRTERGSGAVTGFAIYKDQNERDYHPECAEKILSFANHVKEEQPKQERKEAGTKKKLDIGKILALKKAGWKYKDIAGEMGTSEQCIASTIYAYNKRFSQKEGV